MKKTKRLKILAILLGVLFILVAVVYQNVYGAHGFKITDAEIDSILKSSSQTTSIKEDKPIQAIQQFQLRKIIQTEEDARLALKLVKAAGFEGIELNGFMIKKVPYIVPVITWMAGMPTGNSGKLNWLDLIKESDLKVVSIHEDLGSILNKPEEIIQEAKAYGTEYIVVTGMFRFDYSDKQAVLQLAEDLNKAGRLLKDGGISFLYHNHNCEFRRVETGERAFDLLLEKTNPDYVNFEFDSFWAAEAGCDAVKWMEKLGTRMKLYHINDRGNREKGKMGSIIESDGMELGTGNMNLEDLITTAEKNGVNAIILETHKNWIEDSPVKSFNISSEYLKKHM